MSVPECVCPCSEGIVKRDYYESKFGADRLPPMLKRLEAGVPTRPLLSST